MQISVLKGLLPYGLRTEINRQYPQIFPVLSVSAVKKSRSGLFAAIKTWFYSNLNF